MAGPSKSKPRSAVAPNRAVVVGGVATPKTDQDRAFCAAWLNHYDAHRAALEAGYSEAYIRRRGSKHLFVRFERYLLQQKELKEKALAREMAIDQKKILEEMVAIGFANPQDYVLSVIEKTKNEKGEEVQVERERQKPLMSLTRKQAAAISKVTFHPDGRVTYELPDEKSKHPYLKDLGQHLGLFHPKLIQEHRHAHRHAVLDLSTMDTAKLAEAERYFLSALGPAGNRMLGIIDADFEEISEK